MAVFQGLVIGDVFSVVSIEWQLMANVFWFCKTIDTRSDFYDTINFFL